jgi:hypothetical protein
LVFQHSAVVAQPEQQAARQTPFAFAVHDQDPISPASRGQETLHSQVCILDRISMKIENSSEVRSLTR